MTRYLSATGIERDFRIDLEDVLKAEKNDPTFDLVKSILGMAKSFRLSNVTALVSLLGTTWQEFVDDGFSYNDLQKILDELCMSLGFTSNSATNLDQPSESASGAQ